MICPGWIKTEMMDAYLASVPNPDEAAKMPGAHAVEGIDIAENAAWVAVARIALNLDELITRE